MFWLIVVVAAFFVVSLLVLRGEDLSYLDQPIPNHPARPQSEAIRAIHSLLAEFSGRSHGFGRKRIYAVRQVMDQMGMEREYESRFIAANAADVSGEWVMPPTVDSRRRILYLHGGAFFAGSSKSHRAITDRLARLTGSAVFALDYRLMPESPRIAGIDDCRRAYRWILENGPGGSEAAESIVVAGDSAGGNLTLMLLAWVRDEGLRQADAGIALSPATDSVMDAPSLRANAASDAMLGPAFGPLIRVPKIFLLWFTLFSSRLLPKDPRISPLRGNLANLPPILVQASDSEMLLDDARRYVAKARAAESPVLLQTWPDMVHVWQMFTPQLAEAEEAYQNIAEFLGSVMSPTTAEPVT